MEGGKISNNTAGRNGTGGGVYVYNGTFTMTGGEISGNRSNGSGAGVILDGNGSFIMTGGKITGNTANFSDQEKYSDSTGAGVYVCAKKLANFSVGGSAQITGNHVGRRNSKTSNVYVSENTENSILKVMNVVSKFSEDAEIGVTTASTPTESGIQIAQGKDGYVISADDRGHFTPTPRIRTLLYSSRRMHCTSAPTPTSGPIPAWITPSRPSAASPAALPPTAAA